MDEQEVPDQHQFCYDPGDYFWPLFYFRHLLRMESGDLWSDPVPDAISVGLPLHRSVGIGPKLETFQPAYTVRSDSGGIAPLSAHL